MIHTDHLGTPQKMTDNTGTVVWAADYKPFGEATITVSTITNNLRFPGQYFDQEIGLYYNYYRDYNPMIGRYIEADLLWLPFFYRGKTYFLVPYYATNPSRLHEDVNIGDVDT
jgi:RHS repeat-associated protein